jgi:sugar (pentulose or hexulose) kinase
MAYAIKHAILSGKTALGIELGSTRIKAVHVGQDTVNSRSTKAHTWRTTARS